MYVLKNDRLLYMKMRKVGRKYCSTKRTKILRITYKKRRRVQIQHCLCTDLFSSSTVFNWSIVHRGSSYVNKSVDLRAEVFLGILYFGNYSISHVLSIEKFFLFQNVSTEINIIFQVENINLAMPVNKAQHHVQLRSVFLKLKVF